MYDFSERWVLTDSGKTAMQSPAIWAIYLTALLLPLALLLLRFRRRPNLPPGPRPWPVIGNLNLIGPLPHRSIHLLSQKHGPIIHLRFASHPVVVASSLDMAEEFLKTHDLTFAGRPKTAAGKYTAYNYAFMTWSDYGPFWRQARKIYSTELFSPKKLASFEPIRVQEVQVLLRSLFFSAGEVVNMKYLLYMLNVGVISRMVLGKKYLGESPAGEADEGSRVWSVEFKEMLDELFVLNGVLNIGDFVPWLSFLDLQGYVKRMKAVGQRFDRFLELVLQEHERRCREASEDFTEGDMVDVLLQLAGDSDLEVPLSRDDVKALTLELIAGGTESSSTTVEWAISELLKQPHIFERAAEELDQVVGKERWVEETDLHLLPYIESIMKETMRMHPVAPLLTPHLAREDCKISGYDIPAGTRVHVNMWSIGRDPKIWDSPEEFRPERFIENDVDVKGKDFRLLPFGSGRRMCPGYTLGLKVIQLGLANILHGFVWKLPKEIHVEDLNMEEIYGLSMPRKVPLEVVVEPRLPAQLYSF